MREIELFELERDYKESIERINTKITDSYSVNNKDLPYEVNNTVAADYLEDIDNKYLPGYKVGILIADDGYNDNMVNYLSVTKITNGDGNIPNVDRFYDRIIWSNTGGYYSGVMEQFEKWKGYYLSLIHIF